MKHRLLGNSLPKAGSSLLVELIELLGYNKQQPANNKTPQAFNYKELKQALDNKRGIAQVDNIAVSSFAPWYVDKDRFRTWLEGVSANHYIFGHLPWTPALSALLAELNYRHLAIIRDPREVLASLVFKAAIIPRFLTADFKELSLTQRLNFMIKGGAATQAEAQILPFVDIYRAMLAWAENSQCLLLRFEDLVGERGREVQISTIQRVANYLDVDFNEAILLKLNRDNSPWVQRLNINSVESWTQVMTTADLDYIMRTCQSLSLEAGYDEFVKL